MTQVSTPKSYPSVRWTSFEWDYNGMKERLESALAGLNKDALLSHSELIKGQKLFMSEKFAAGQYWICFEMVAEDGTLVIARVRLPWHPKTLPTVSEEDELYAISCEVSTMQFVAKKNPIICGCSKSLRLRRPRVPTSNCCRCYLHADRGLLWEYVTRCCI